MIAYRVFLWLLASVAFISLLEYVGHRFFMHRPVLDRFGLRRVFRNHAILHHHGDRNDLNVDLPIMTHFVWGFPILIVIAWIDIVGAMTLSACYVAHSILWTKLHRAIHGLEHNCTKRLWFYALIKLHHLEHHRQPRKNFGAVFPFTDYVFGTAARSSTDRWALTGSIFRRPKIPKD
jgi:hypothetical protein